MILRPLPKKLQSLKLKRRENAQTPKAQVRALQAPAVLVQLPVTVFQKFKKLKFKILKLLLKTCYFLNDTELLRLPHYQIRQTIAQSKRLDEYTSGKPKKNSQ